MGSTENHKLSEPEPDKKEVWPKKVKHLDGSIATYESFADWSKSVRKRWRDRP